jgi:Flp pilus assembly protein TadG
MSRRAEPGQSAVETALVLPFVVFMAATVLHVGIIVRDHLAFWRTAGTAARLASVTPDDTSAVTAFVDGALDLRPTTVDVQRSGDLVITTLRHRYSFRLLFVDTHLPVLDMVASVTMHAENVD